MKDDERHSIFDDLKKSRERKKKKKKHILSIAWIQFVYITDKQREKDE